MICLFISNNGSRNDIDKPPSRKELQVYIEKKFGDAVSRNGKKAWKGIKIREDPSDTNMILDDDDTMSLNDQTRNFSFGF